MEMLRSKKSARFASESQSICPKRSRRNFSGALNYNNYNDYGKKTAYDWPQSMMMSVASGIVSRGRARSSCCRGSIAVSPPREDARTLNSGAAGRDSPKIGEAEKKTYTSWL